MGEAASCAEAGVVSWGTTAGGRIKGTERTEIQIRHLCGSHTETHTLLPSQTVHSLSCCPGSATLLLCLVLRSLSVNSIVAIAELGRKH